MRTFVSGNSVLKVAAALAVAGLVSGCAVKLDENGLDVKQQTVTYNGKPVNWNPAPQKTTTTTRVARTTTVKRTAPAPTKTASVESVQKKKKETSSTKVASNTTSRRGPVDTTQQTAVKVSDQSSSSVPVKLYD